MITIAELIKRDGRWLGGQSPQPKYRVAWKPGTIFLPYPKSVDRTKRELMRIMNRVNPLLADSPWEGKRKTHRSSRGPKLYAVRDGKGRFKDIQVYERAHQRDLRRKTQ